MNIYNDYFTRIIRNIFQTKRYKKPLIRIKLQCSNKKQNATQTASVLVRIPRLAPLRSNPAGQRPVVARADFRRFFCAQPLAIELHFLDAPTLIYDYLTAAQWWGGAELCVKYL
jgi:hypothetical protein